MYLLVADLGTWVAFGVAVVGSGGLGALILAYINNRAQKKLIAARVGKTEAEAIKVRAESEVSIADQVLKWATRLQDDLMRSKNELDSAEKRLDMAEDELKSANVRLSQMDEEIKRTHSQLKRAAVEIDELKKALQNERKSHEVTKLECAELKKQIKQLQGK